MKSIGYILVEILCRIVDFKEEFQTRVIQEKPLKSWRVVKKEMEKQGWGKPTDSKHLPGET